jgi:hypothetical protein
MHCPIGWTAHGAWQHDPLGDFCLTSQVISKIKGLSWAAVNEVASLIVRGQAARKVGETAMNRESSRSHSVFTCTLECASTDANGVTQVLHSRLNLVDLAGGHLQRAAEPPQLHMCRQH